MIRVITGHICAGKSTYVKENAKAADVVIDLDRIANAVCAGAYQRQDYPDYVRQIARDARWAAITAACAEHRRDALGKRDSSFDVWIIHAYPTDRERRQYELTGAVIHEVKADAETLRLRASTLRGNMQQQELEKRLRN